MSDISNTRFPQLSVEDLDDEQRRAIAPVLEYAGGIRGPFNATLRSPRLTETSFALGTYLLFETGLPRRLVEMAVLIGARVSGSRFEWWAHHRRALEEGLDEGICDALRQGRRPDAMSAEETALFDLAVEVLTRPAVSDATFARARDAFGERGVVDLTYLVGFYGMISLVLKVAEVEPPDDGAELEPMVAPFSG
jgi:4-carboxymuconolactone decarboxylase